MRTLLQLLVASLVLLTQGFGQEPKRILTTAEPVSQAGTQTIAIGSPQPHAPLVQPKALPPLNPSLGEIARQARAAHAAAAKAQVVVETDTTEQK